MPVRAKRGHTTSGSLLHCFGQVSGSLRVCLFIRFIFTPLTLRLLKFFNCLNIFASQILVELMDSLDELRRQFGRCFGLNFWFRLDFVLPLRPNLGSGLRIGLGFGRCVRFVVRIGLSFRFVFELKNPASTHRYATAMPGRRLRKRGPGMRWSSPISPTAPGQACVSLSVKIKRIAPLRLCANAQGRRGYAGRFVQPSGSDPE